MAPGLNAQEGALQLPKPASWDVCFPSEPYSATDRRAMLIQQLLPFLSTSDGWGLLSKIRRLPDGKYALEADYAALRDGSRSADLVAAVDMQPAEGLLCIAAAAHEALFAMRPEQAADIFGPRARAGPIAIRLVNYRESATVIRLLKAAAIGKLVTIRGTVVRSSPVRPLVSELGFACSRCGEITHVEFTDGLYQPPRACGTDGCRGRAFAPQKTSAVSLDWQRLRVQELSGADAGDVGGVPRTIEVELLEDLAGACGPGDAVTVLGLVKAASSEARQFGKKEKCLYILYLEAVSVVVHGRKRHDGTSDSLQGSNEQHVGGSAPNMEKFTAKDLQFIAKFTEEYEGVQFRHLVHALCPGICGQELAKAALVLALLGGVRKLPGGSAERGSDGGCGASGGSRGASGGCGGVSGVPTRGDIHVLLCGDPGLGKSQLLQAAARVAPRGIYVCGNASTAAGLTATVVRDASSGGGYVCEAGALVLADRGACCIDEFDKMTGEHQALLGAMEQQEVTVSKAGVCATLPARASVLAAANPAGGRYTRAKTFRENLRMSAALLSRFDVAMLLLDRPDEALDARLSEHVLAAHAGCGERLHAAKRRLIEYRAAPPMLLTQAPGTGRVSLLERLRVYTEDDADPMPPQLMRKYIAYARAYVHPTLTEDAKQVLKEFYLDFRREAAATDGAAATTRQLEAAVRLTEARARADLRASATAEDARDAVELLRAALPDGVLGGGSGGSAGRAGGRGRQAEAQRFLSALRRRAETQQNTEFAIEDLFDLADALELAVPDLSGFVEQLNEAGELLKRGGGRYSLPSSHRVRVTSSQYRAGSRTSGSATQFS